MSSKTAEGDEAASAGAGAEAAGLADDGKAWRQQEPAGPEGDFFAGPPQQAWLGAGAAPMQLGGAKDAKKANATAMPNALRIIETL
jgi:hypothetical protein